MQRNRNAERSLAASAAIGVLISIVISILFSSVVALLVVNGRISAEYMQYFAYGIQLFAVILGAYIAGKLIKQKAAVVCGIVSGTYMLLLLAVNILLVDSGISNLSITLIAVVLGWGCSCALCMKRRERRKYKKVRNR